MRIKLEKDERHTNSNWGTEKHRARQRGREEWKWRQNQKRTRCKEGEKGDGKGKDRRQECTAQAQPQDTRTQKSVCRGRKVGRSDTMNLRSLIESYGMRPSAAPDGPNTFANSVIVSFNWKRENSTQ